MFGADFINDEQRSMIDPTYKNMGLRSKETFAVAAGGVYVVALANATRPLLFLNCNASVGFMYRVDAGTTVTFYLKAGSTGVCSTYIFDTPLPASETYGLRVRDINNVVVFDSNSRYMRVVEKFNVWMQGYQNVTPSVTRYYATGKYAVCLGIPRTRHIGGYACDSIICTETAITVACNLATTGDENALMGTMLSYDGSDLAALVINVNGL